MKTNTGQNLAGGDPAIPLAVGPAGIDVGAIERELNGFWEELGKEDQQGGVIRSCVLNLLVYVDDRRLERVADEALIDVTLRHPSRVLLMTGEAGAAQAAMAAHVISRCTLPTGNSKQVCCEQVMLTATGTQVNELPSAAASLLLSDLPVYLWWCAAPAFDNRVFRRLSDLADRIVIDLGRSHAVLDDLIRLGGIIKANSRRSSFSDLSWSRLTAWRKLLAGFYDVAEYRSLFGRLSSVRLVYAPPEAGREQIAADALLLLGWLASRLGWQLESAGRSALSVRSGGQTFAVLFEPSDRSDSKAGQLIGLSLESAPGQIEAGPPPESACSAFHISQSQEGEQLITDIRFGEEQRTAHICRSDPGDLSSAIGHELETQGHDRIYEQAVIAGGEIADRLRQADSTSF